MNDKVNDMELNEIVVPPPATSYNPDALPSIFNPDAPSNSFNPDAPPVQNPDAPPPKPSL